MSERDTPLPAPAGWHDAFSALPLERPAADAWPRIAAGLAHAPRPRRLLPWAVAATIACLAALPAVDLLHAPVRKEPVAASGATDRVATDAVAAHPSLEPLYAESARLETLLALLSVPEPSDGMQLALSVSLRSRVSTIDEALSVDGLDEATLAGLWRQRVDTLQELASLTAGQRWNALHGGAPADYALLQVH